MGCQQKNQQSRSPADIRRILELEETVHEQFKAYLEEQRHNMDIVCHLSIPLFQCHHFVNYRR